MDIKNKKVRYLKKVKYYFGAALVLFVCVSILNAQDTAHAESYGPHTMYTPSHDSPDPGSLYGRSIRLKHSGPANGTMLSTFEQYVDGEPSFPIYKSTDNGESWDKFSSVKDQVNNWGMRYQPFLYELPEKVGNMSKGTLLLAGNSIPDDLSKTQLDLYKSTDNGKTWSFVSHIASGGKAEPENGLSPVWEPFLKASDGKLIAYYADQRDPDHGQKLVHQVSADGLHWDSVVDDVTLSNSEARPGMPTVAKMGNGKYIMTYENYGAPEEGFPIYYKISSDPEDFENAKGNVLKTEDGTIPTNSPYVVWMPTGGPDGTVVVSGMSSSSLFVNTHNGDPDQWKTFSIDDEFSSGYSRSLVPMSDDRSLFILNGGDIGADYNTVKYGMVDLGERTIYDLVNKYRDSGDIDSSFGRELENRSTVIHQMQGKGHTEEADKYLKDFLKHINDSSVQKQGLVSKKATDRLNDRITSLLK